MPDYREIEDIMARLMPVPLSEDCVDDIAEDLGWQEEVGAERGGLQAELTGGAESLNGVRAWYDRQWLKWAAVGVAVLWVSSFYGWSVLMGRGHFIAADSSRVDAVEIEDVELVSASNRLEAVTDEGFHEDMDGLALRSMRLNVVEINTVRDQKTGIVMNIQQPREEIVSLPITRF